MMAWKVKKVEELESQKCLPEQERLRGLAERLCWALKDEWLHGELVATASEWLGIDVGLDKQRTPPTTHRRGFPEWLERWQAMPEEDKLRELVRCLYCEMPGRQNGIYNAPIQTAKKELAL